jgi:hypothetical protein
MRGADVKLVPLESAGGLEKHRLFNETVEILSVGPTC